MKGRGREKGIGGEVREGRRGKEEEGKGREGREGKRRPTFYDLGNCRDGLHVPRERTQEDECVLAESSK